MRLASLQRDAPDLSVEPRESLVQVRVTMQPLLVASVLPQTERTAHPCAADLPLQTRRLRTLHNSQGTDTHTVEAQAPSASHKYRRAWTPCEHARATPQ